MELANFHDRCAAHNLTCCVECSVKGRPFMPERFPAARERPIDCVCGYKATDANDLEEHILISATFDDDDHAEAH